MIDEKAKERENRAEAARGSRVGDIFPLNIAFYCFGEKENPIAGKGIDKFINIR